MTLVERKLRRDIVPWLKSAEKLTSWYNYRIYTLYFWLGEAFVLLVGLGFSHPLSRAVAGTTDNSIKADIGTGEGVLFYLALAGLIAWGLLKTYTQQTELQKRCSLIKSGIRQFRQISNDLQFALGQANPLDDMTKLQEKISEQVNRMLAEDAWPWIRFAPDIEAQVDKDVKDYLENYSDQWKTLEDNAEVQQRVSN